MLDAASVSYRRHLEIYPREQYPEAVKDEVWLEMVGRNGWTVITADKRNRYEPLEKAKIIEYKVREFTFASGSLSGDEMAKLLKDNLQKIERACSRFDPPLIASISQSGINIRFPPAAKSLQAVAFKRKRLR